jgi:8-oxo-dGTP pyrophosphatase MutT (NUDIX family)/transcriptional regulator with XRE-family HTH domain
MNLRQLRDDRRLSTAQLAAILQDLGQPIQATGITKTEAGTRRIDIDDLVALAVALDVSPNRLLLPGEGGATHDEARSWSDGTEVDLTPVVRVPVMDAWAWATGESPLPWPRDEPVTRAAEEHLNAFRQENRPHAPGEARYFDKAKLRSHPELVRRAALLVHAARQEGVPLSLVHDFITLAAMTAINGDTETPTLGEPMTQPASTPEPPPVAAAIVTSSRGVLAGRRNDGKPPWTFIAGEVEPGETAPFAAVREVKEETGLEVRAAGEIGRRVHPKTGRTMIYIAAEPVRPTDLDVFVGDTDELAEVRWVSLAEADELLPGMFEPVHDYLEQALQGPQ